MTRIFLLLQYFGVSVASYLFRTSNPTKEQISKADNFLMEALLDAEAIHALESGVARAMRFALFPEERDVDLLPRLIKELSKPENEQSRIEARNFCSMAESFRIVTKETTMLREALGLVNSDYAWFIPWVRGPERFSQPFSLQTRHGNIVFVFNSIEGIYSDFFKISSGLVSKGYTLQTWSIIAKNQDQLLAELAKFPLDRRCGFVFEGTKTFSELMMELATDKIWPSE